MATFLFDDIIFGPVKSRRLGASLGINLLPVNGKFCNFNCIYCECGWSAEPGRNTRLPSRAGIRDRLEEKLIEIKSSRGPLDRITFAGNGEPTMHPEFAGIIEDTIAIRDRIFPGVKIAVLSNATRLDRPEIFRALGQVDQNILKLDSAMEETVKHLNQPPEDYRVSRVIDGMMRFGGKFILQTLFVKGEFGGIPVDNSTENEVKAWLEVVKKVNPRMVMIYTIDRDTPIQTIWKIKPEALDRIAGEVRKLGVEVQVSY